MNKLKRFFLISFMAGLYLSSVNAQNLCSNVALKRPATASSSWSNELPDRAFDGDISTNWSANQHTGWIQVDLQNKVSVDSMKLYVNQAVPGNTIHEISISEDLINWTLAKTISSYTVNAQILTVIFDPVLNNVRGVKVNTPSSTAWVAWYEIEIFAIPYKPTITQEGMVLTSSSETNNQWYSNGTAIPGATSQTYTAAQSGSFQVGVTYGNDCVSMSEIVYLITTELINTTNNILKIYPNPSKDNITIEGIAYANVEIINLQGQVVKNVIVTDNNPNINIADISNGIYSIRISTNESVFVQKLLKD